MTTYNAAAVADTVIATQKGITVSQGRALRDNPIAMSEGAAGAPLVQGHALGGLFLGFFGDVGSGYTASLTANYARTQTLFAIPFSYSAGKVSFSTDGGSTWGADLDVSKTGSVLQYLSFDLETGDYDVVADGAIESTRNVTVPVGTNAIRFRGITGAVFAVEGRG